MSGSVATSPTSVVSATRLRPTGPTSLSTWARERTSREPRASITRPTSAGVKNGFARPGGRAAANIGGVENVIRAAGRAGSVQLAVYASSRLVFDIHHRPSDEFDYRPTTAYGASKAEGERIVRDRAGEASPWLMVRPTSIWGPWFGVPYRDFFDAVLGGRYVHPAGLQIRKSYGYVGNSVFELERLIEAPPADVDGRVFWLADYPPIEVAAWAAEIRRCAGLGPVRSVPTWVLRAGGRAGDLLARVGMSDPPLTSFRVDNLLTEMVYDSGSTQLVAGELPFTMAEGVRATVEWLRCG